jgi:hypothetical protein
MLAPGPAGAAAQGLDGLVMGGQLGDHALEEPLQAGRMAFLGQHDGLFRRQRKRLVVAVVGHVAGRGLGAQPLQKIALVDARGLRQRADAGGADIPHGAVDAGLVAHVGEQDGEAGGGIGRRLSGEFLQPLLVDLARGDHVHVIAPECELLPGAALMLRLWGWDAGRLRVRAFEPASEGRRPPWYFSSPSDGNPERHGALSWVRFEAEKGSAMKTSWILSTAGLAAGHMMIAGALAAPPAGSGVAAPPRADVVRVQEAPADRMARLRQHRSILESALQPAARAAPAEPPEPQARALRPPEPMIVTAPQNRKLANDR